MTRDNKRYTKEEKESLVRRMLPPENISTSLLSIETGISKPTLATCKSKATGGAAASQKEVWAQEINL